MSRSLALLACLDQLRRFSAPNVFNPWAENDALDCFCNGAFDRGERLIAHFNCTPKFLLIGEAPGYQGCKFSGIPFTNEKLLLDGAIPRVMLGGRITTRPRPWCEPSATIVWRTLHALGIAENTCMANAFNWHPHKPQEPYSNRAPTSAEIISGKPALMAIVNQCQGAKVVAVGKVAQAALRALGIKCEAVRHPSMGGAKSFAAGMREIVSTAQVGV